MLQHICTQSPEIQLLPLDRQLLVIHLGNFNDIPHQGDEPQGFLMNVPCKPGHILGPYQAVPDDLGKSGDRGEGRLQFMGDIGCELPAVAVLFLVLLGQVLHLVPNLLILSSNAPDQRAELLIGLALQRGLQVNAIDGLHHIPGRSGSQQQG